MEASLRIIKRGSPTYSEYIGLSNSGYYAPSKQNTFTLADNYSGFQKNQDRNLKGEPKLIKLSTNKNGFRTSIDLDKKCKLKSQKTILFLGDSYTFGVYLRDKDTYPSKFQYLSNKNKNCFKVINAGYANGHETDQIYSWLVQNIKKIKPDYIIYNIFGGNDILGINSNFWIKQNEQGLPTKWINKDIVVKNGFLRNKKSRPPLNLYYFPILRESKLLATLENKAKIIFTKANKKEYGFKSANFAHLYGIRDLTDIEAKEDIFFKLIKGMNDLSKKYESKLFTVYLPANFEVYPELLDKVIPARVNIDKSALPINYGSYLCESIKNKLNLNCLDITIAMKNFKDGYENSLDKNLLYPSHGEIHMSKSGADFTSQKVFEWFRENIN